MAGGQLRNRIIVPLLVISGSVAGLAFVGVQLLGLSGANDEVTQTMPSMSASPMPTSATPTPTPTEEPGVVERLPVIVLNGTDKAGYAKQVGDALVLENWTIQEVGNWDGDLFLQNMVFFPAGYEAAATELALSANVNGMIAPAEGDFSQTALTVVLAQ